MGTGASKRNISCPVCKESSLNNKEFVEHYRKTHNRKCTKCGLSGFETEESMQRHYDEQHNKGSSGEFPCWKCAENFADETGLMQHLKSEHHLSLNMSKLSVRSNIEKPSCSECGKLKKNSERLQKHVEKNHRFICQKCDAKPHFSTLKELIKHGEEEHTSLFKCPIKCTETFSDVDDFLHHLLKEHNFAFVSSPNHKVDDKHICPQCNEALRANEIFDHVTKNHIDVKPQIYKIKCPKCKDNDVEFETSDKLLDHMREEHDFASKANLRTTKTKTKTNNKSVKERNQILPKVGDRVLAMWEVSMWQYFHATIKRKMEGQLRYEIDWDDGDTTGWTVITYFLVNFFFVRLCQSIKGMVVGRSFFKVRTYFKDHSCFTLFCNKTFIRSSMTLRLSHWVNFIRALVCTVPLKSYIFLTNCQILFLRSFCELQHSLII